VWGNVDVWPSGCNENFFWHRYHINKSFSANLIKIPMTSLMKKNATVLENRETYLDFKCVSDIILL
jgi:hypothetical protein